MDLAVAHASSAHSATETLQDGLCDSGDWKVLLSTVILALYGVACVTWHALSFACRLLEMWTVFKMMCRLLGFQRLEPEDPVEPSAHEPQVQPVQGVPGGVPGAVFADMWACDSIRNSHKFHIDRNCFQLKSARRWQLVGCDSCTK
jgi:hypothetical protein